MIVMIANEIVRLIPIGDAVTKLSCREIMVAGVGKLGESENECPVQRLDLNLREPSQ
jgi:hypothetical protein